jgi:RimJ/RimL family protein N-acetyltransferase
VAYVVRRIRPGEWRQLRALRLAALQDAPTAFGTRYADATAFDDEVWQRQAAQNATSPTWAIFVVTTEDGRWVGMTGCAPLAEVPGTAHLHGMYVAPAHRGRPADLAARLVQAAVRWAADHTDAAWLTLGVHEDNARARACYQRIGFTETGTVVPYPLDPAKKVHILGWADFRKAPAHPTPPG